MGKGEVSVQIDDGLSEGLDLQEISWCETFLRTASIRQACKEALLDVGSAKKMLEKPIVQAYIMQKTIMYKNANDAKLNREDLKKILNNIAQDPTTSPDLRINAVSKLNSMMEFDAMNKEVVIDEEVDEIKLTAEEADAILRKIRNKEEI